MEHSNNTKPPRECTQWDEGKIAGAQICSCQQCEESGKKEKIEQVREAEQTKKKFQNLWYRQKTATYIRDHRKSQELSREEGHWIEEGMEGEAGISIFLTNKTWGHGRKGLGL